MKHVATPAFWRVYNKLPQHIQAAADECFNLLKQNSKHPSLHFKKVGVYRSVRVGIRYRALAVEKDDNMIWFWIGSHAEYDNLVK